MKCHRWIFYTFNANLKGWAEKRTGWVHVAETDDSCMSSRSLSEIRRYLQSGHTCWELNFKHISCTSALQAWVFSDLSLSRISVIHEDAWRLLIFTNQQIHSETHQSCEIYCTHIREKLHFCWTYFQNKEVFLKKSLKSQTKMMKSFR